MATTTNYGWTTPDDSDPFRNGASAIRTLGSSADTTLFTALGGAYPGLRRIKTQTIPAGVTSQEVTGAFSTTYDAYRIVLASVDASAVTANLIRFGAATTNYYASQYYDSFVATTNGIDRNNNTVNGCYIGVTAQNDDTNVAFDVVNPFLTKRTTVAGNYFGNVYTGFFGGTLADTTSYTSFTIAPATGTLTGGTITVYGYGKS
jgi:hypothetical protein